MDTTYAERSMDNGALLQTTMIHSDKNTDDVKSTYMQLVAQK